MITIDIDRAKTILHAKRRAARATKMAPLDIKATIPSEAVQAELDRQAIREKNAAIQEQINKAATPDDLNAALKAIEN